MNVYAEAITLSCVYILVLELVYCDSKYNKYERTEKFLLQSEFKTLHKLSVVSCCEHCRHTNGCKSVSFKPSDGECRLSSLPSVAIQQEGMIALDWNTYIRLGKTQN